MCGKVKVPEVTVICSIKCPYLHPSLPWVPSPTAPYQLKRAAGPIPVPSAMTLGGDIADGQWLAPDECADFPQTDGHARVHLVQQHDETPPATSFHIRCLLLSLLWPSVEKDPIASPILYLLYARDTGKKKKMLT